MKASTILSLLGLLSTSIAAPSHSEKKDVNIFLHEPASDHVEASMGPILSPGVYLISSPTLEGRNLVIGRGLREDRSLLPKQIKLCNGTVVAEPRVDLLGGRRYRLSVAATPDSRPSPVANINGNLFAILTDYPLPGEWIIEYQLVHNAYTIVSADDRGLGWVADPEPEQQVSVKPIIVFPTEPPRFPPTQLFTFKPSFNDDMASTKKAGLNIEVTVEDL